MFEEWTHCEAVSGNATLRREFDLNEYIITLLIRQRRLVGQGSFHLQKGYLSTVIGLGLVIISLIITVAALMFDVPLAALSGLVFLGWAIPAIAHGLGKWLSARREMTSMLKDGLSVAAGKEREKQLVSEANNVGSRGFAGSVTEGTTASLDRRT